MRHSGFKVIKEALTGHKGWNPAWRDPEAYGQKRIAVLEKGWIGGGNAGPNTTIIRSNYLPMVTSIFKNFLSNFGKELEQDFNYSSMIGLRGILN